MKALAWFLLIVTIFTGVILLLGGCSILPAHSYSPPPSRPPSVVQSSGLLSAVSWATVPALVGISIAVIGVISGHKFGLPLLLGCVVFLVASLVIQQYAELLSFLGLLAALGFVGWLVWTRVSALRQIVQGIERAKIYPDLQSAMPARAVLRQSLNGSTSQRTKALVDQIKAK